MFFINGVSKYEICRINHKEQRIQIGKADSTAERYTDNSVLYGKENKYQVVGLLRNGGKIYSEIKAIKAGDVSKDKSNTGVHIDELNCDKMTGYEFERFCAELLKVNGFVDVKITKGSGDQGIDIIARKDDIKYGIQCKCYDSDIGNKSVQEAFPEKCFTDVMSELF